MIRNSFNRIKKAWFKAAAFLTGFTKKQAPLNPSSLIIHKYHFFQEILSYNNDILRLIDELEDKLSGDKLFGLDFIKAIAGKINLNAFQLIKAMNHIADGQYSSLYTTLERINNTIQQELNLSTKPSTAEFIIPYKDITGNMLDAVGGKNATLGEIRNKMGLAVPDGFAITTYAYDTFIRQNDLYNKIRKELSILDLNDQQSIESISKKIQSGVINSTVPAELLDAIDKAYGELEKSAGRPVPVAIRSSAVNEDGFLSFAGQYESMLNVNKEDIPRAYKQVIASLYYPSAIFYLAHKGLAGIEQKMGVGCMTMVNAKTAGIIYTKDPNNPDNNTMLINAVMGLGKPAVDGTVTPDVYSIDRNTGSITKKRIAHKKSILTADPAGGVQRIILPEENSKPCLEDARIHGMSETALQIERYYNAPQDIEWCIDEAGKFFILQSRQLRFSSGSARDRKRFDGYQVILDNGNVVCPGIGTGKAFILKDEKDIARVPAGAVLVAPHPSPVLVRVMDRVHAIVTDTGGIAGHMATMAREFNIPTITDTENATSTIADGEIITVDAGSVYIYRGTVPQPAKTKNIKSPVMKDTPVYGILKNVGRYIIPLNLTDPMSKEFGPDFCKTIHDITRFCHEKAIASMFTIADGITGNASVIKVGIQLPVDLYVLDIGAGIKGELRRGRINMENIASVPFYAFMKGFTHMDIRWWEPRRIDVKGFFSVLSSGTTRIIDHERPIGKRSYAVISNNYLNFNSRVGYHFSTIDAYCDERKDNNYITFYFQGGASEDIRRFRRAKFLTDVLASLNFVTDTKGDRVMADLRKYDKEIIENKLDMLGRLTLCALHLDMLMTADSSVEWFVKAFLEGNYNFEPR
jgi:pyruvate,water dikinase